MSKTIKVLYFVEGVILTPAQIEEATSIGKGLDVGVNVEYVNAQAVTANNLVPADAVAGDVPEAYKEYPTAKVALGAFKKVPSDSKKASEKANETPTEAVEVKSE